MLGIISGLLGGGQGGALKTISKVIDDLHTSDEEKLDKKILMQRLQQNQTRFQEVSAKEMLLNIDYVRTTPAENDPTSFFVEVGLRNGSNEPINLTTFFTVPQVIDLSQLRS